MFRRIHGCGHVIFTPFTFHLLPGQVRRSRAMVQCFFPVRDIEQEGLTTLPLLQRSTTGRGCYAIFVPPGFFLDHISIPNVLSHATLGQGR